MRLSAVRDRADLVPGVRVAFRPGQPSYLPSAAVAPGCPPVVPGCCEHPGGRASVHPCRGRQRVGLVLPRLAGGTADHRRDPGERRGSPLSPRPQRRLDAGPVRGAGLSPRFRLRAGSQWDAAGRSRLYDAQAAQQTPMAMPRRSRVSDTSLRLAATAPNVWILKVAGASITKPGLEYISGMSRLNDLYLADVPIDDSEVPCLGQLSQVRRMTVKDTRMTAQGIRQLQHMLPGTKIWTGPADGGAKGQESPATQGASASQTRK